MALNNVSKISAVEIDSAALGTSVLLTGISQRSLNYGFQTVVLAGDGLVDPAFIAAQNISPVLSFSTTSLGSLFALGGSAMLRDGIAITNDADNVGCKIWYTQYDNLGNVTSGDNHKLVTISKGKLCPKTISGDKGQVASADCDLYAIWDEDNAILTTTDSQALPDSQGAASAFLGTVVYINGTRLQGIESCSFDCGHTEEQVLDDANIYPILSFLSKRNPTINITTLDLNSAIDFGVSGEPISASTTLFYRQLDESTAVPYADAGNNHISIALHDGLLNLDSNSGGGDDKASSSLIIIPKPVTSGSSNIFTVSTNTPIAI